MQYCILKICPPPSGFWPHLQLRPVDGPAKNIPWMILESHRKNVVFLILDFRVKLDNGLKRYYTIVEPSKYDQAEVDILVGPQPANCFDERIALEGSVCMLCLRLLGRSMFLIHVHGLRSVHDTWNSLTKQMTICKRLR